MFIDLSTKSDFDKTTFSRAIYVSPEIDDIRVVYILRRVRTEKISLSDLRIEFDCKVDCKT